MPRKTRDIGRYAIHRSQLYHQSVGRSVQTTEIKQAGSPTSSTNMVTEVPAGINGGVVHLWRATRDLVFEHANTLRWELSTPFTIPAGPGTTSIPYDNENIGGQGALYDGVSWRFMPPTGYAGAYHVGGMLTFLAGAAQACRGARLELWVTDVLAGTNRLWSVIDQQYINPGDVEANIYLEQILLKGTDIIDLECHEILTVQLWTDFAANLIIGDMASLYGYVYLHWCGCHRKRTDMLTTPFNLPTIS